MNKVLFALVFLVSIGFAAPPPPTPIILPSHFLLVLQWPLAYCMTTTSGTCFNLNQLPNEFKVHGLWPEVSSPFQPGKPEPLKPSCLQPFFKLAELQQSADLNKYWPNITGLNRDSVVGYDLAFWKHEWDTHGRCQPSHTQREYFPFVLQIFKLTQGITEDIVKKYSGGTGTGLVFTREIKKYIQTEHHLSVDFKCKPARNRQEKFLYLQEIYFNVSLDGELQNMVSTNYNSCPVTQVKFSKVL